jgi:hypothetical protein
MSSTSLPLVTCIPVSSPPPSPSPLAVSAPENMPVHPLSPQLARHTEPLLILEDVDDAATSIIEYLSVADPTPNEEAPVGFVLNNRDGRHFYCHGSAGTPLRMHANGEAQGLEEARTAIRT